MWPPEDQGPAGCSCPVSVSCDEHASDGGTSGQRDVWPHQHIMLQTEQGTRTSVNMVSVDSNDTALAKVKLRIRNKGPEYMRDRVLKRDSGESSIF